MSYSNTTQTTSSMPNLRLVVSNKFTVHCDLCGEAMTKQADVYACYPCRHMLWESEIAQYDVRISNEQEMDDG